MKLLFQNSYGEERVISEPKTEEEAYKDIVKFCDEHNYKMPYCRTWKVDNRKHYDCGSWSEFFILVFEEEGGN